MWGSLSSFYSVNKWWTTVLTLPGLALPRASFLFITVNEDFKVNILRSAGSYLIIIIALDGLPSPTGLFLPWISSLSSSDPTTPTLQQVWFFKCFWSWLSCLPLCLPVWKAAVEGLSCGPNLVFKLKTEGEVMLWSSCEQKPLIPCSPDNNSISKAGALLHFDRIAVLRGPFLLQPPGF